MPRASYRVLADLFAHHLHFTPTATDIAAFERDLAVVSPSLMKASLVELGRGRSSRPVGVGAWRDAIYAVYNRKVAEHAQLFPMFHCFETAFRSRTAVSLEEHYQTARWWDAISADLRRGGDGSGIARVGIIDPITSDQRRSIVLLIQEMTSYSIDVALFQDGYELMGRSTLGQVKRIISSHWPVFRQIFKKEELQISRDVVMDKFEKVRSARNAVYHHMSLPYMTDVYQTAQELMAYLPFPLPKVHGLISAAACGKPPYK